MPYPQSIKYDLVEILVTDRIIIDGGPCLVSNFGNNFGSIDHDRIDKRSEYLRYSLGEHPITSLLSFSFKPSSRKKYYYPPDGNPYNYQYIKKGGFLRVYVCNKIDRY